jgi:hypothetical protein
MPQLKVCQTLCHREPHTVAIFEPGLNTTECRDTRKSKPQRNSTAGGRANHVCRIQIHQRKPGSRIPVGRVRSTSTP